MSLNVSETRQSFPYPYEKMFDGLIAVLGPAGFPIKSQDRVIGRITASAGMSGFSWGENVTIQVERRSEAVTDLLIQSNLKVGFNVTATGKNAQNAERIIGALSHYMQSGSADVAGSVAAAPAANSSPIMWLIAIVVGAVILLGIMSQ